MSGPTGLRPMSWNRESQILCIACIVAYVFWKKQSPQFANFLSNSRRQITVEVAIHSILYVRNVYPADLFVRRKKYDTPVWQARHPGLHSYVVGAIRAIRAEMLLGTVDKVVLVIKERATSEPLERFVFGIRTMLDIPPYAKDDPIDNALTPNQLGLHFRGFLTKLLMIDGALGPVLPPPRSSEPKLSVDAITFTIVLELDGESVPSASAPTGKADPPPWIPADRSHTTPGVSADAPTTMIRAVETGVINVALLVQESEAKVRKKEQAMLDTQEAVAMAKEAPAKPTVQPLKRKHAEDSYGDDEQEEELVPTPPPARSTPHDPLIASQQLTATQPNTESFQQDEADTGADINIADLPALDSSFRHSYTGSDTPNASFDPYAMPAPVLASQVSGEMDTAMWEDTQGFVSKRPQKIVRPEMARAGLGPGFGSGRFGGGLGRMGESTESIPGFGGAKDKGKGKEKQA